THRYPGLVPRRAVEAFEGDLHHEPRLTRRRHRPHRAEAVDRVVAHVFVDQPQLLVGETEIGLADRHELSTFLALVPDAEGEIRIEARALAVSALGIHEHRIHRVGIALP